MKYKQKYYKHNECERKTKILIQFKVAYSEIEMEKNKTKKKYVNSNF